MSPGEGGSGLASKGSAIRAPSGYNPLGQGGLLVPAGRPAVPAAVVRRPSMHVRVELLRWSEPILAALRKDGWAVAIGQDGVSARHPQAPNERAARRRLH